MKIKFLLHSFVYLALGCLMIGGISGTILTRSSSIGVSHAAADSLTSTPGPTALVTPSITPTITMTPTATITPSATMTPTVLATSTTTATTTSIPATSTSTPLPTRTASPVPTGKPSSPLPTAAAATPTRTPLPNPAITVSPTTISLGGVVYITGTHFLPTERVTVTLDVAPLGIFTTTATGVISETGVSIPYTTTIGSHTITVHGATIQQTASAAIQVVKLNPSVKLSATTGRVGQTISVNGCGYGPQEGIVLALNGSGIATSPAVITSTTAGCFTATVVLPTSSLSGLNTLSASGTSSRATSYANLTISLPTTSTWYFAGASTMTGETAHLSLLNVDNQPASVQITFMYADGHQPTHAQTVVGAHTRATVDVGTLVGAMNRVGIILSADRHISAQLTEYRAGQDRWTVLGVSAPNPTWYFAEGYTGLTFHEAITLFNPQSTTAVVTVRLLPFNGKPARTISYTVAAQQEMYIPINPLMPNASLSIIVSSSQPIVAQRVMTFGAGSFGTTAKQGANISSPSWYFAEGSTLNSFETYLTVLNPNPTQAALVTASFFSANGASLGNVTIVVDALHRGNIKINDTARSSTIATIVTSNTPIVVERPMYFGAPNSGPTGGSDVFGRNGTGVSWTFPGGSTAPGQREFLLIQNPNPQVAMITAQFYTTSGSVVTLTLTVPPFSRQNIDVNRDVPNLPAGDHSTILRSTNNVGFVAEQSTYDASFRSGGSTQGEAQ